MSSPVVALAKPAGMALSPGGEHLYVAATEGDAVVAFTRHPSTGLLGFLGAWRDGDPGVGSFVNDVPGDFRAKGAPAPGACAGS